MRGWSYQAKVMAFVPFGIVIIAVVSRLVFDSPWDQVAFGVVTYVAASSFLAYVGRDRG